MSVYTEYVTLCNQADIQENEMKVFDFNEDTKVLLIKQNGELSAVGNKCSHYGAPLHTGVLGQGHVRCPWHGACFNIKTGDIEDFPGLDSLPCFNVQVETTGEVKVRAKKVDLTESKRLKNMASYCPETNLTYVVVGGGPAGAVCAETLRQEGFTGRVIMICRENALPYDRIKVSKSMNIELGKIEYRNSSFYNEHSIETMVGVEATKLDIECKTVLCSNGKLIQYDKIFIATGCCPIKPPIKGADLNNVVTVRDHSDADFINNFVDAEKNVVCLGSSFIALESAAYLAKKVKSVTVIARDEVPLLASFGKEIGQRILDLFTENGVKIITNSGITEIFGSDDNKVKEVILKDGSKLPCDLLIMGTGSKFYTDFLKESGVELNANGTINTDMYLMTNVPSVFAGGDIANAPVFSNGNQRTHIGHIQLAQYHGRIAAINMVGQTQIKLKSIPFFFTMIFGKGLRYAGYGKYSDVLIEGDLPNFKFVAYYLNSNNKVIAVASCGRDPIVAQFAELQAQDKCLHRSDIEGKEDPTAWTKNMNADAPCKLPAMNY
ncbi:apoptosis-inducing factor 3-like [Teleopsis dalmanni]|nr:apoptosis-inducing factor 3-like [Teleopsis dalmanni]